MIAERKHVYLFTKLVYRKAFLENLPIFLNPSIENTFCLFCSIRWATLLLHCIFCSALNLYKVYTYLYTPIYIIINFIRDFVQRSMKIACGWSVENISLINFGHVFI